MDMTRKKRGNIYEGMLLRIYFLVCKISPSGRDGNDVYESRENQRYINGTHFILRERGNSARSLGHLAKRIEQITHS